MYLIGNVLCTPTNKSNRPSTDFTVANTKDLDQFHRGKVLEESPVGALAVLLHRLQRKKKAVTVTGGKKTAPGGVFCMSGPVAHVDEEEGDHEFLVIVPDAVSASNRAETCFVGEKALSNGDIYVGSWHGNLPEGMGKYLWADGCMYEGQWCRGVKTGKGKISWPSGATYEGDFMGGQMHGFGTYTGIDGATYKGQWLLNDKHGYGRKCYKIGDFYEGFWKHGVQDGRGRYVWRNGNEYAGEWRGGLMCGSGILSWSSGDKYDGQWLNGLGHGNGVYKWADGSYYVGTWSKGLKDGKGTFYPSCNYYAKANSLHESSSSSWDLQDDHTDDGAVSWNGRVSSLSDFETCSNTYYIPGSETSSKICDLRSRRNFSSDVEKGLSAKTCIDSICVPESNYNEEGTTCDAADNLVQPIVEREYVQGVLINEYVKENSPSKAPRRRQKRHSKEGKRPGEIIFKGHRNYDLMLNLQLGIRYTVGRITPEPKRDVFPADFGPKARICMRFPPEGSTSTPPHQSADFKWKDYCPMVFRHLRELFKIDAADYMLSICGNDALRELSSPGKSGSVFYLSHDDRFMIKTMRKTEVKVLLGMLPNYYNHVRTYESTLITKFFGLHTVKPAGGQKVRFIVMGNMFCSELRIHRRFDLKGSSQGRSTDKVEIDETTTLKDLDLDFVFHLEPSWRQALLKQIECDCKFLEAERIMDYSLLLGLHLRAPQFPTVFSPGTPDLPVSEDATFETPIFDGPLEDEWNSSRGLLLVPRDPQRHRSVAVPVVHGDALKGATVDGNANLVLPGTARLGIRLGVNMPARAVRRPPRSERDSHPEGELFGEDYDVVLYFGIIDILQDYDITKRLEHAYKSLQFDSLSISAVDPKLYSKRFQDFICRIFPGD